MSHDFVELNLLNIRIVSTFEGSGSVSTTCNYALLSLIHILVSKSYILTVVTVSLKYELTLNATYYNILVDIACPTSW